MRRRYGAGPLHLGGHLACLALAGYALAQIAGIGGARYAIAWLIGAVVLHDAVLWPLYATADRLSQRGLRGLTNHVRIPAGLSLVTLLVFYPVIASRGAANYERAAGRGWDGYAARWLLVTGALFAVSGLVYLLRRGGSKR